MLERARSCFPRSRSSISRSSMRFVSVRRVCRLACWVICRSCVL
jgi:hypothetical protein